MKISDSLAPEAKRLGWKGLMSSERTGPTWEVVVIRVASLDPLGKGRRERGRRGGEEGERLRERGRKEEGRRERGRREGEEGEDGEGRQQGSEREGSEGLDSFTCHNISPTL